MGRSSACYTRYVGIEIAARGKESSGETKNDLVADVGSREKKGRVEQLEHDDDDDNDDDDDECLVTNCPQNSG